MVVYVLSGQQLKLKFIDDFIKIQLTQSIFFISLTVMRGYVYPITFWCTQGCFLPNHRDPNGFSNSLILKVSEVIFITV